LLRKIEFVFVCVGLLLLIMLIFLAALLRFWGIDMSWSVDLAQLTFAWTCFIGADLALAQNRHMGVDMFLLKLPRKVRLTIEMLNSVMIFAFLVFVAVYGMSLCIVNWQRSFQTLPISYSLVTASAPTGALLMIFTLGMNLKSKFMELLNMNKRAKEETV